MEHRRLGLSGLVVSRLALGTMGWGRDCDEDVAQAQLAAFREAGGTLVDTADVYGNGESERMLGGLMRGSARSELVIATKAGARSGDGPLATGTSRRRLLAALDGSLNRLRTDHVDLWQVHTWHPDTPLEETLAALDYAVSSGKARYVGVSNYAGWQTAKAATYQRAARAGLPWCRRRWSTRCWPAAWNARSCRPRSTPGSGSLPWSPLGRGVLAGTYGRSRETRSVRLAGRVAQLEPVRRAVPDRGVHPRRRGRADRRQGSRGQPGRRGHRVGTRSAGGYGPDRRRPHRWPADRLARVGGADSAAVDPQRAG